MIRWTKRLVLTMHVTALALALGGSTAHAVLQGDCGGDGTVFIGDVQQCVNIFLNPSLLPNCTACDQANDGGVDIGDIQGAANCFLNPAGLGCQMVVTPVPTATSPMVATNTPTSTPANTNTVAATSTPTNTPANTNTVAATSTPTNTPANTNTIAPTSTATNTQGVTATPTVTPTMGEPGAPDFVVPVRIIGGGGLSTQCQGTCASGPRQGLNCSAASQCRVCNGGVNQGNPCVSNAQCTGSTCSAPSACSNATCRGGGSNGLACTAGSDCAGCNPNLICSGAGVPLACCTGVDMGNCPVRGSCALVQNPLFAVRLGLNGVCVPRVAPDVQCVVDADCPSGKSCQGSGMTLEGFDNGDGTYRLRVPQASLFLPPAVVSGIGTVCVVAGGDGVGTVDCDGGTSGINFTLSVDHNTTPAFTCLGGDRKGLACTSRTDCTGLQGLCSSVTNTCASGPNAGMPCAQGGDDCPEFAPCNNDPAGSPVNGNGGPQSGLPDDPECDDSFVAPTGTIDYACEEETRQCDDGPNDGKVCTSDADCPQSTCGGLCNTESFHAGTCNSPTTVQIAGTFAAGDLVITLPLAISILETAEFGPDALACTGDDMPPDPPAGVPVALSTGINSINVFDAANAPGGLVGPGATCGSAPCVAQVDGNGVSCANLLAGQAPGMVLGGGFPALDTTAGDIATVFQFVVP